MRKLFSLAIAFGLISCVGKPLTEQEKSVRVLRQSDAPSECKELGRVKVSSLQAISEDAKEDYLKRESAKLGGNTVAITNKETGDFKLWTGVSFDCPSRP